MDKRALYLKRPDVNVYEIRLDKADNKELMRVSEELGIGLSIQDMLAVKEYFARKGRNPTDVELQTIGQTWSEHCFHRTFKGVIKTRRGRTVINMFKSYIAKVTEELKPDWCLSVFEDNAGIVEFDQGYAIAVKVETHNHPSAIEPFGGAATGVGGVIRDILGVWGEPIANTDVLCFGPLDYNYEKLPKGVKHPRYLFRGVVAGIGYYGNNMGIPTVNGAIYFDEGYVGNVVVYCGCIGLLPKRRYVKSIWPGDLIVLAGGRTGRDGIHGVTFASAELTEEAEVVSRPAVQIPNPIEEEKLRRAILTVRDLGAASYITDLGGGGLSSAVGEAAYRFRLGAWVELGRVPLKHRGMSPWEIWVSESQERMLLSASPQRVNEVLKAFHDEEVEAVVLGCFTEDQTLKVSYQAVNVAELDVGFLFNPPTVERVAVWRKAKLEEPRFEEPRDLLSVLLRLLSAPNVRSREEVIRTYDHEVQGITVVKPLQGLKAGPNDAAVLKPLPSSWMGLTVSCGIKPSYGRIDPYWMAASAVDEAVRNNVAVGGRRIALLDNFTWGNPERPDRLGGLLRAVKACYRAAKAFKTPFISGKDSLYNESVLGPITPTLLITAVGIIPDVRMSVTANLKEAGNPIYLVGLTRRELGGSEYYRLMGMLGNSVPKVDFNLAPRIVERVTAAIDAGYVRSCHDLSEGGLGVAIAEMLIASRFGAEIDLAKVPAEANVNRNDFLLFSESNTRFLVEVRRDRVEEFKSIISGIPCNEVGLVVKTCNLTIRGLNGSVIEVKVDELEKAWKGLAEAFIR
ncbi:MAG: phosphoribosylformylglycinamidine synthase subunit PurL [Candidatus Nezhaarchaeales archaeon]